MSNKKEQMQVRVMGGLIIAAAGYFGFHMFAPSSPPAPRLSTTTAEHVKLAGLVIPEGPQDAPAPYPGMKNPFVPAIADLGTAGAAAPPPAPVPAKAAQKPTAAVPALPAAVPSGKAPAFSVPSLPAAVETVQQLPLPASAAAPAPRPAKPQMHWIVSGVLNGGGSAVAILRDGDARRFVRQGDLVDSTFRVMQITPSGVVLKGGGAVAHLQLTSPGSSQARTAAHKSVENAQAAAQPATLLPSATVPTAAVPNIPVNALPVQQ